MRQLLTRLDHAEEYLACVLMVVLFVMLTAQIIFRFAFSMGFSWLEELSRIIFVWIIMFGAVVGMRRHLHIRVELGLMLLPLRLRPAAELLGALVLVLFCLSMTWYGAQLLASVWRVEYRLSATGLSMFWAYLAVPVSFGLQALRIMLRLARNQREPEVV